MKTNWTLLILTGVLAFVAGHLALRAPDLKRVELKDNVAPPEHLEHLSFGFHEVVADLFWIRALQDFGYCESQVAENRCRGESWLYQMLDTITNLSPKYRIVHATGPLALSVIISDIEGASKLFDKAVAEYPKDWPILYRAAYHAILEEKNNEKGAELVRRAAQNGGPTWFYSLAAHLYSEAGQRLMIKSMLQDLEQQKIEPEILERVRKRLEP